MHLERSRAIAWFDEASSKCNPQATAVPNYGSGIFRQDPSVSSPALRNKTGLGSGQVHIIRANAHSIDGIGDVAAQRLSDTNRKFRPTLF
jgi:hypothetical protein